MADTSKDALRKLELVYLRNDRESSRSLSDYLNRVVIDCRPEPRPFGEVIEPWQQLRNLRLVPALEFVAGIRKERPPLLQFYEGMSKGQDKSSFTGRVLSWILGYAVRPNLRLACAAKDAEQAGVIRDCMWREASLNPWLMKHLDFSKKDVKGKNNGSVLNILASDAAGSHGSSYDVTVCDENTNWDSEEMFEALFAGAKKKEGYSVFIVLTNAGTIGSWQWKIREMARERAGISWSYFDQPVGRPMASWITPAALEEARLINSSQQFRRLWLNEWLSATEDRGAFRPEDVDKCVGDPVPVPKGATAVIGVDFGGVCDRTAMCVTWWDGQKINVPTFVCWEGSHSKEIKVEAVDRWIDGQLKKYPKAVVVFDVHQLLGVVQKLEDRGVNVVRTNWKAGKTNVTMLQHLRTLLTNGKLCYGEEAGYLNGETLVDELKSVITSTTRMGERFDHDPDLHDDRTSALGMACLEAIKYPPTVPMSLGKSNNSSPPLRDRVNSIFSQDHLAKRGLFGTR